MLKANNFGALGSQYRMIRRGYPEEVYDYLLSVAPRNGRKTLDMGCGTGISTRELKIHGFDVEGLDKEKEMLDIAKEDSVGLRFTLARAESMPFNPDTFDVVTAFTAFHWFQNSQSTSEIIRILKPGGLFFVALKDSTSIGGSRAAWKEYASILEKYVGNEWNSIKDYRPKEFLENAGFKNIQEREFPVTEYYTIEESISLMKSLSFWNLVKLEDREAYLDELKSFFIAHSTDGLVKRDRAIRTIIGYK